MKTKNYLLVLALAFIAVSCGSDDEDEKRNDIYGESAEVHYSRFVSEQQNRVDLIESQNNFSFNGSGPLINSQRVLNLFYGRDNLGGLYQLIGGGGLGVVQGTWIINIDAVPPTLELHGDFRADGISESLTGQSNVFCLRLNVINSSGAGQTGLTYFCPF